MNNKTPKSSNVGYGKPPAQHQWKPGQSGNPSGKGKKAKPADTAAESPKLLPEIFAAALSEPLTVTKGGQAVQMSFAQAFAQKLLNEVLAAPVTQKVGALRALKELGVFATGKALPPETDDYAPLYTEEEMRLLQIVKSGLEDDDWTDLNDLS